MTESAPSGKLKSLLFYGLVVIAIVVLVGVSLILVRAGFHLGGGGTDYDHNIVLPVLIVGGTLVLLVTLAVFALIFSLFGLSDKAQALALPEGSVRAVIALILVMMYSILTIYLYSSINAPAQHDVVFTSETDRDAFKKAHEGHVFMSTIPDKPAPRAPDSGATDVNTGEYHLTLEENNSDATDFAKQILTTLGTLVTAISAFYFGARSATSGVTTGVDAAKS